MPKSWFRSGGSKDQSWTAASASVGLLFLRVEEAALKFRATRSLRSVKFSQLTLSCGRNRLPRNSRRPCSDKSVVSPMKGSCYRCIPALAVPGSFRKAVGMSSLFRRLQILSRRQSPVKRRAQKAAEVNIGAPIGNMAGYLGRLAGTMQKGPGSRTASSALHCRLNESAVRLDLACSPCGLDKEARHWHD